MMRIVPIMVIIALLAVACSETAQIPEQQPAAQQPAENTAHQQSAPPEKEPIWNRANPETENLLANIVKVKSYSFDVAFLPDARARYHYLVKGDNAKVVLNEPITVPGGPVDVVYLNLTEGSAVAYCTKPGICADLKHGVAVDYAKYNITLPPQWTETLKYGAKAKSLTFYDAPVTVVEYERDGRYYEAYVQNFYGMPVRVAIATDPEMTNVVSGYEYRNMAFNTIKESDVTPPQ